MTRVIASILVLALVSPALAVITCDAVCALTAHDPASMTMTCHEHMGHHHDGIAIKGTPGGPCHDDGDSPAAVLYDSLQALAIPAAVPAAADAWQPDALPVTQAAFVASRSPGSPPLTSQLRI